MSIWVTRRDLLDRRRAFAHLAQAIAAQGHEAFLKRRLLDRGRAGALDGEGADLVADRHHLVDRGPADVAGLEAVVAAEAPSRACRSEDRRPSVRHRPSPSGLPRSGRLLPCSHRR